MDVVISEFISADAVERLRRDFEVFYDPGLVDRPDELRQHAADCRALIVRNRTQVDQSLLDHCPRLHTVGRLGVGLDNIDTEACERRGVAVYPATGANTVAVAELVLGGLLWLRRGVFAGSASVADGAWPRQQMIGRELFGSTLGLVGFGAIAQAVAERARAFSMRLLTFDPFLDDAELWPDVERVDRLETLLARADAVSLHVPLSEHTRHLLDAEALARMKPDALLVNTARGGVIDETALAQALGAGRLGGALLDVFAQEPLAAGSALADVAAKHPRRLLLTPHIGGVTEESNVRVSSMIAERVAAALRQR